MKKLITTILTTALLTIANNAQAVVFLWNNTGTNWTSPTSWTNGVQPSSTSSSTTTDEIQFGNVGANNNTVVLTSATRAAQNITFLTNANAYNINSFNGAQTLSSRAGITNNSTATQTFNILVENANNSNTWFQTAGGELVFNNVASLTTASSSTSRLLTLAGDGAFTFNNELRQGGSATGGRVLYTGNGTVTFNGTNTLGGGFEIKGGGTVNVNGGTGMGTGLITIAAATGTTNGPKLIINTTNGLSVANSFKGSSSLSTMATLDLLAGNDTNAVMTFVVNQYQGNNMSFTNHGIGKTLLQFTNASNILTSSTDNSGGRRLINNSASLTIQFDGTLDIGSTTADVNIVGGAGDFLFKGSLLNTASVLRGLTKTGTGTVTLQAVNTYNGETIVQDGTLIVNGSLQSPLTTVNNGALLGGSGSLQGVLLNRGTISAGNSAGLLSMNSLNASNGNFIFELGAPSSRGITYDAIDVSSLLTLGTDTDFTFETLNNYVFADGDTYDLFNWGSADMTNFNVSVLEAALPSLASTPELTWNVSQFTLDGSVSVSIIPEPTVLELITAPWQALKALCRMQAEFAEQNPVIATIQTGI
jgi:autotransporter-associated beta strand protein